MVLDRIKPLLGITDTLQDETLTIIIDNVTRHLTVLLGKEVPPELDFIIEEISIRRYNRIGTEGAKSESVEGHTTTYYDLKDDFVPYEGIIASYKEPADEPKRGRVMFF